MNNEADHGRLTCRAAQQAFLPFLDNIRRKGPKTGRTKTRQGVVFGKRGRGQGREYGRSAPNAAPRFILDSIDVCDLKGRR